MTAPSPVPAGIRTRPRTRARLAGLVPSRVLAGLVALTAAQAVLIIAQADLLARAISRLDPAPLPWLVAAVAGRAVLGWASGTLARAAAAAVKARLRRELLARAGTRPSTGEFTTLLTRGLDAIDPYAGGYLPQLVAATVVPLLVVARIGVADPPSMLIILVTLPLIPIFGILIGLRTRDLTRRQWAHLKRLGGHFGDVLAGFSTLRAFGRTAHQAEVVRRLAEGHRAATMRALRVAFLSGFVLELVCALSVALVAVPVGLRLIDGSLALGTALVVLLLTPEAFLPPRALGIRFHAAAEGLAVAERVFAVLDEVDQVGKVARVPAPKGPVPRTPAATHPVPAARRDAAPPSTGTLRPETAGDLRLENVTVRFPGGGPPALDRVSLSVRPGERVAVVGPSGAGKSTLLAVLLGLVTPGEGRVLVGGADLATLDPAWWWRRLAWVPQRPHLFAASVADNIRLGTPAAAAPAGRVRAAARAAAADGFIAGLPDGYATVLGERGGGLSAGQRQRIALARAFLRDAPVVLLDEPTARLDARSEAAVLASTAALLRGRTAVMVAHRPGLLAVADRVVRLRAGRIDDAGAAA